MADIGPITYIPCELIERILKCDNLTFVDTINFASTCKHFKAIVKNSNSLWRRKFFQRCPGLKEPYNDYEKQHGSISHWIREVKKNFRTKKELFSEIAVMCTRFQGRNELAYAELDYLDDLFCIKDGAHPMAYKFLQNELIDIVTENDPLSRLTIRYYSLKILRYMNQRQLTDEWKAFFSLPMERQTIEKGAVLLAQWCQPKIVIEYKHIAAQFDTLANEVKDLLRKKHPKHPIFTVPAKWFNIWKENIIEDNQFTNIETRRILEAMCEVLFVRHHFNGDPHLNYEEAGSLINLVLEHERGTAVALAIVFEAVARRLGVKCEPINFPSHFMLRWRERYDIPDSVDSKNFYIDLFNGGRFVSKEHCPRVGRSRRRCPIEKFNTHSTATAKEVVVKLACSYETAARQYFSQHARPERLRTALELRQLLEPKDSSVILQLCRYSMLHNMDATDLRQDLRNLWKDLDAASKGPVKHMLEMLELYETADRPDDHNHVNKRNRHIKYPVGAILVHEETMCLCVVVGWDYCYDDGRRWNDEPNVGPLRFGRDQPYYKALFTDGSAFYIAQEKLALPTIRWRPEPIDNSEIGRYFDSFNGIYYVMNDMLKMVYPDDSKACEKILEPYEIVQNAMR